MKIIPKRKLWAATPEDLQEIIQNVVQNANTYVESSVADFGTSGIIFVIDGGGAAIETGVHGHIVVPFNCEILSGELEADQEGSIKVDIWEDVYTNFPPDDSDSICGGNELEIVSGVQDKDAILTGWYPSLSTGDILAFNVDSCSTIERCTVALLVKRT